METKGKDTKSRGSSTRNDATLTTTGTAREVIAIYMAPATLIAGRTTVLIVGWIAAAIKATVGQIIDPVTAMVGRIMASTADTPVVAGTTILTRADTFRHGPIATLIMV